MRVKKPKRPTTPPSEDEEDGSFVADPDQIFDELPQPFRLIDKTLRNLLDKAWERIEDIEQDKALRRSKAVLPLFELGKQLSEYQKTTCICSVDDGRFLFIGFDYGLAVVDSETGATVAAFEEPGKSFLQMSACCLQEEVYLICTLDSLGFAKLFSFSGDKVLHVRTFNEQEGATKQAVANLVQISPDCGYIGIGWEGPAKESWLEVYKLPKETWIKEVESAISAFSRSRKLTVDEYPSQEGEESTAVADQLLKTTEDQEPVPSPPGSRPSSAQGQPPSASTVASFSKPVVVLRVRPPAPVGPCSATNCSAALKAIDADCNVIGSGANHVLLSQYFENSEKTFRGLHEQQLQYLTSDDHKHPTSCPTVHFLTPGRLIPSGMESSPYKVNSLAVWWSGSSQLFIYSLVKSAKDVEHKPDVVWPNSEQILVSTSSKCGSLMAMGLNNGTVVVWDIYRGALLRVCPITDKGKILVLQFLPSGVVSLITEDQDAYMSPPSLLVDLVVSCDDGTFCLVQSGVAHSPSPQRLLDKSAVETEIITHVVTLPKTPQVIAAVKKSGQITLYDVATFCAICHVGLPESYHLMPVSPCFCLDGTLMALIGAQIDQDSEEGMDAETSKPFLYHLQTFPTLNNYWTDERTEFSSYKANNTLDLLFHSLIQDRLASQGNRQSRLEQRWSQYKTELKGIYSNKTRRNYSTWFTSQKGFF